MNYSYSYSFKSSHQGVRDLQINSLELTPWHRTRTVHDDVIKWKRFPRNWPFVRGIHRSPVNSPHKGQWRGASMFLFLIRARINGWVNNCEAGGLRHIRHHYDVTVMTGLILGLHPANKRRRYKVTSSLTGWAQALQWYGCRRVACRLPQIFYYFSHHSPALRGIHQSQLDCSQTKGQQRRALVLSLM